VPREFALRSYVRYIDANSRAGNDVRKALIQYIGGAWSKPQHKGTRAAGYQVDVAKRLRIEKAAMECVAKYYGGMKFVINPVPNERKGWDLEAQRGSLLLRIEVKGCSGSDAIAELTPNEYAKAQVHQDSYRVCLVTNALTHPKLHVFQWNREVARWTSDDGTTLRFEEKTAATIWVG
jgi:hypothetical protein